MRTHEQKKVIILAITLFIGLFCISPNIKGNSDILLPQPKLIKYNGKNMRVKGFRLSENMKQFNIQYKGVVNEYLGEEIEGKSTLLLELERNAKFSDSICFVEEAYHIEVTPTRILIQVCNDNGVFNALATLSQLIQEKNNGIELRSCTITDWPAFKIRGYMHDVGRRYIPIDSLKKEIRLLRHFKINTFHWHLTEDLGWRIESKIYPKLNDSSTFVRMPGMVYRLTEIKEFVEFCRCEGVRLIPEIDMPGHSKAFEKAFGVSMQSEEGEKIVKALLDEMLPYFNGVEYVHIGTDEVKFTNPNFVPEMVQYIREKGFKVISWNPGWNYNKGEIDMTQLWSARGKATPGVPCIDSRYHYLNHYDQFADVIALYRSTIARQSAGDSLHLGVIAGIWNDRAIDTYAHLLDANAFYPSLLALAERSWIGGGHGYFDEIGVNFPGKEHDEYKEICDFERRMLYHKTHLLKGEPFCYVKQTNIEWCITDPFPNNGILDKVFPPEIELDSVYHFNGNDYHVRKAYGATVYLRHVWGDLIPSFFSQPGFNSTTYAYTWVYSKKEQDVGAYLNTQNYSRSEKDIPAPLGCWDYRGSKLWINNKEIVAPNWANQHRNYDNEIPLRDENFECRPPTVVHFKKGWNKVIWKLPVGEFHVRETRLSKWMFTTVFVSIDGKKEVEGLVYSTNKRIH